MWKPANTENPDFEVYMSLTFKYAVYQHGYQLHHMSGTIPAVDASLVDAGNTLKEQSLLEFLSALVVTKLNVDYGEIEVSEKTRQSLLGRVLSELIKHSEYHVYSVEANGQEQEEIFVCSGDFLAKLKKVIGLTA